MIHFQCACGTTVSAEDGDAGREIGCVACGRRLTVPRPNSGGLPPGGRQRDAHDFDEEIVRAARTAPPRPRKTPQNVRVPAAVPPRREKPSYDLTRLRDAPGVVRPVAWLSLLGLVAVAVSVVVLAPGALWLRAIAAGVLAVLGAVIFVALSTLAEVCGAVGGLADDQRELSARVGGPE